MNLFQTCCKWFSNASFEAESEWNFCNFQSWNEIILKFQSFYKQIFWVYFENGTQILKTKFFELQSFIEL